MFVTQDDPFYVPIFFDEFMRISVDDDICIQGVIIQTPLGKKSTKKLLIQMFNFYGLLDFIKISIKYLTKKILSVVAVNLFRGHFFGSYSLRHLLMKHGWRIVEISDVNSPSFIHEVEVRNIDLIVSVAASQVFKSDILSKPKFGCINVHNSKLPEGRGMLPNFWALYNADSEPSSAMTVHKMNPRLDDGEIILQEEFLLDPKETLHELIKRTKRLNAHLVLKAIKLFEKGEPPCVPNDASLATYHTFPTREDVRKFRAKGLKLV